MVIYSSLASGRCGSSCRRCAKLNYYIKTFSGRRNVGWMSVCHCRRTLNWFFFIVLIDLIDNLYIYWFIHLLSWRLNLSPFTQPQAAVSTSGTSILTAACKQTNLWFISNSLSKHEPDISLAAKLQDVWISFPGSHLFSPPTLLTLGES